MARGPAGADPARPPPPPPSPRGGGGGACLGGRLVLPPHAAFYTPESLADMRRLSMLAVVRFLREGRLRSCVNLDALRANGHEPEAVRDGVREELRRRAG